MADHFHWVIDSANPIRPSSLTHFGGYFDPQVTISSLINHITESIGAYRLESTLVPMVTEYTPEYFQGWSRPQEFVHSLIFFSVASVLLTASWFLAHTICNLLIPSFASIAPAHKKWYVIANWSKAIFLCIHSLSLSWWYYSILHYRCVAEPLGYHFGKCTFAAVPEQGQWTKFVSAVYVMTDVVALVIVPKLPHTTVVHHYAALLLMVFCFYVDLDQSPVAQKMCMYGFWSTLAWNVNLFLAERVGHPKALWLVWLSMSAAATYASVCFFNWGFHALWFAQMLMNNTLSAGPIIWLLFMSMLIRDDLILMKWLWTYSPELEEKTEQERAAKKKS